MVHGGREAFDTPLPIRRSARPRTRTPARTPPPSQLTHASTMPFADSPADPVLRTASAA